jgi:8-oxo-dGTP pyrophosphatase MutT (NUDIX family)
MGKSKKSKLTNKKKKKKDLKKQEKEEILQKKDLISKSGNVEPGKVKKKNKVSNRAPASILTKKGGFDDDDDWEDVYDQFSDDEPLKLDDLLKGLNEIEKEQKEHKKKKKITNAPLRLTTEEFPGIGNIKLKQDPVIHKEWNIWDSKIISKQFSGNDSIKLENLLKGLNSNSKKFLSPILSPNEFPGIKNAEPKQEPRSKNVWDLKIISRKNDNKIPEFKPSNPDFIKNSNGCIQFIKTAKFKMNKQLEYQWEPAKWVRCENCTLWHSNREIPIGYLTSGKWKVRKGPRKKVGIILVRNDEVWVIQSYNNCYGFPKGEKESDENEIECALREFHEETGTLLDTDLSTCKYLTHKIENILYMFYIVNVDNLFDIVTTPDDDVEITTFGWCKFKNVGKLKFSKVGRVIFKKWMYGKKFENRKRFIDSNSDSRCGILKPRDNKFRQTRKTFPKITKQSVR